jgi:hypothetical protein
MKDKFKKCYVKLAISVLIFCAFLLVFTFQTADAQALRIYHIDVEQADATLIISPSGT